MATRFRSFLDEPTMSDKNLLVSVEDLIAGAFGPFNKNTVNFKLLQAILHILTRELRLLEQEVEIKFDEYEAGIGIQDKTGRWRRKGEVDDGEGGGKDGEGKGVVVGKDGSATSVSGPGGVAGRGRVGSIEVVTASQFALLEKAVKQLESVAAPLPTPSLPENEKLRADLAKGRASLQDTMQAVQLNARVQAAEQGLSRMAELLTQLAVAGVLPEGVAAKVKMMQFELQKTGKAKAGGKAGEGGLEFGGAVSAVISEGAEHGMAGESKGQSTVGTVAPPPRPVAVLYHEMQDFVKYEKGELNKDIQNLTARANYTADMACNASRNVAEKLEIALRMNERISTLKAQTEDYANQLSGFDSGLVTQMTSFQEQMAVMRSDLNGGLTLFETANNSAETAAILDLNERCEGLIFELESTIHEHTGIAANQQKLGDELKSLVECVEMLREQKADRDEVLDGLRDKADISRLVGLLHESDFAQTRDDLEHRIHKCYDKFIKQDAVWNTVLEDLLKTMEYKAPILMVISLKESVSEELNNIRKTLKLLEIMLGEPKAAILMRKLADNTACAACMTRALMEPKDRTFGAPCALPPLRPPPLGSERPCLTPAAAPPDLRKHICHRWVGGSHTLLPTTLARQEASPMNLQLTQRRKFEGTGNDGRYYMMEEELQPCEECNLRRDDELPKIVIQPPPSPGGGGDQREGQ